MQFDRESQGSALFLEELNSAYTEASVPTHLAWQSRTCPGLFCQYPSAQPFTVRQQGCVCVCVGPSQHVQCPIKAQNPIYILLLPWPGG